MSGKIDNEMTDMVAYSVTLAATSRVGMTGALDTSLRVAVYGPDYLRLYIVLEEYMSRRGHSEKVRLTPQP